jgi:hypothetical protein
LSAGRAVRMHRTCHSSKGSALRSSCDTTSQLSTHRATASMTS